MGGCWGEQALSYAIQYARGDTLLPTTSLGTAQGVFTRSWAKTIEGLPDGEAGLTLALARSRSGNSIKREEKKTLLPSLSIGMVVAFRRIADLIRTKPCELANYCSELDTHFTRMDYLLTDD